jgi:D-alanyl-D-alanine carboxypeptidase
MRIVSAPRLCIAVVAIVAATAAPGCSGSGERRSEATTTPDAPPYQLLLRLLTSDGRSGAVAILETREGTWRGAAGWADFDAGRRADPEDRFAIENVTISFVAAVVLQLVQERRLSLRSTVQRWLPGLFRPHPKITVGELLNHTSGLPRDFSLMRPLRERVQEIGAAGVAYEPGTESVSYANYVLLGLIVEKVTGRRLDRVAPTGSSARCTSRARATASCVRSARRRGSATPS